MSQGANIVEHQRRMQAVFDAMAVSYDGLEFVRVTARRLVELVELPTGARVLDVATGTGLVAMLASEAVGPGGRVVGSDLSAEMVAQARKTLAAAGYPQVELYQGDAAHLDFADHSFDVLLCASAIFFMPDLPAVMQEWRRVLAVAPHGGQVAFTSFGPGFMEPLVALWVQRQRAFGLPAEMPPTHRLAAPEACRQLLSEAGFSHIRVQTEQLGYFLPSPQARWDEIEAGLEGGLLKRLTPTQRGQLKAEHLADLAPLVTPQGLWVSVPANFAFGELGLTSD